MIPAGSVRSGLPSWHGTRGQRGRITMSGMVMFSWPAWCNGDHFLALIDQTSTWLDAGEVQEQQWSKGERGLGKNPEDNSMYCNFQIVSARCLRKWPHETFGRILDFFLVELNHIIKEKEWWWWCPIWQRFVRFQIWGYLHIVSKSPLVKSLLVNLVKVRPGGQHERFSPWHGLGWHGKSWPRLVWRKGKTRG
jgi:hypothetical protein